MATTFSITPAALYARLLAKFGGNVAGATDRQNIIKTALMQAAQIINGYARWPFRHRVLALVTVANQAYTTLPSDYQYDASASPWLAENVNRIQRPTFCDPRVWDSMKSIEVPATATYPTRWTVGNETINQVVTPVVRWWPVPTGVVTFNGFQYWAALTAFDETGSSAIFTDPRMDILWDQVATAMCGVDLKPVEGIRVPGMSHIYDVLEDAKARWVTLSATDVPVLDENQDSNDLSVQFAVNVVLRDSSGGMLI
jgi:hypothetical protein